MNNIIYFVDFVKFILLFVFIFSYLSTDDDIIYNIKIFVLRFNFKV